MSPVAGQHGPRLASPLGEPHVVCHYHNLCRSWFSVYHCPQPDTVNTASDSLHFVTINRLLMVRLNNRNTGKRVYTSAAYGWLLSITYMYVGGGLRVNIVADTVDFVAMCTGPKQHGRLSTKSTVLNSTSLPAYCILQS